MLHVETEHVLRGLELHLTHSPGSLDRFSASCFPSHPTPFYSTLATRTHPASHYPPLPNDHCHPPPLPGNHRHGSEKIRSGSGNGVLLPHCIAREQVAGACTGTSSVHLASNRAGMSLIPLLHAGTCGSLRCCCNILGGPQSTISWGRRHWERGVAHLVSAWRGSWLERKGFVFQYR